MTAAPAPRFIKWLADISIGDLPGVGGRNASPGGMFHALRSAGVQVPDGFAVTAGGYRQFMRSDSGSAGVTFTIDTGTGFEEAVLINASYGPGENVVHGPVNPDEYRVFKPTLKQGFRPILQKRTGSP
jgi:phosphoenolpyruvate synthase/pyruvate phosphate dikinase